MKSASLHGVLIGAAVATVWCLAEAARVYAAYPYDASRAAWLAAWGLYLVVGASCGLVGGLLARWLVPAGLRAAQPWPAVAAPVLGLCVAALCMLRARADGMPAEAGLVSVSGALAAAQALGWGTATTLALLAVLRFGGVFAWATASLAAPFSAVTVLALGALAAGVGLAAPHRIAPLGVAPQRQAAEEAPNILLVVLDTVRADHLGSYGYYRDTSPRLDALAAEGVRFESAFAAAPWTLPSHASLFTGLHPQTHGTGWEHPRLHDGTTSIPGLARYDFPTLAEELAMRGYATFGAANKSWIRAQTGLTQGFAAFRDLSQPRLQQRFLVRRVLDRYLNPPVELQVSRDKGGERLIDDTLGWLDARDGADAPFFAFLNLNEAHDPYFPPDTYWTRFLPEGTAVEDTKPRNLDQSTEFRRAIWEGKESYSEAEIEILKALYDALILYQDDLLGKLVDGFADRRLLEDTLIVVTADHGEEFLETGNRIGHQMSLSDRLVRVPLVMRWPAGLPSGRVVDTLASLVDVFPTLLEVSAGTGEPVPGPPIEGVSLLRAIAPDGPAARDMAIAHYGNPASFLATFPGWDPDRPETFALSPMMRRITMLRGADRKYYLYGDGAEALLDLAVDPLEASADSPAESADAARMRLYRMRLQQQLNDHLRRQQTVFGHLQSYRTMQMVGDLPLHELGYAGGSGEATGPAPALPPFLGFR